MTAAEVKYLAYSGRDPCWGCSRRLQRWYEAGQVGPRPAAVKRSTWRRGRGEREWPLCPEHKIQWEAHDMEARRLER